MAEKKEVSADKLKVLNAVLDKIEKDFGKGAVMRMSSDKVEEAVSYTHLTLPTNREV